MPDGGPPVSPMLDVGPFCIERDAREVPFGRSFENALRECRMRNRRLCTYGEWLMACLEISDQLTGMTDNFERVDDVDVEDGGLMTLVVGNGSCSAFELRSPAESLSFRCCL
jgi:hypothetical protein